ncbi:dnaJ homolog subfamily C member 30, mitochondrial [Toxorhynchites rutilus septentrionalis]|uniref:dnaJ homolog subfamily C member 30, mitochondrial n=1 Tax=Toxorhynchites rutilus septentrionalis TaxID=329112 RepID=UPI00247AE06D|nr:dnaJ homolog subfamily C member 30, mitochondrial [Toxorhynchites rutilus septentrionalis]
MNIQKIAPTVCTILNKTKLNIEVAALGSTYCINQRSISLCGCLQRSHYDSLGITSAATQNDIKQAYYNLSKLYHPDINKDSTSAAEKFRAITEAYEILGNYRLRKLYDKGILHTAGRQYAQQEPVAKPPEEDDPQTRFYKKRMTRTHVPTASGRTPIYDFDEWSRAHYGQSFERKKAAEQKARNKAQKEEIINSATLHVYVVFATVSLVVLYGFVTIQEQSYDTPRAPVKNSD